MCIQCMFVNVCMYVQGTTTTYYNLYYNIIIVFKCLFFFVSIIFFLHSFKFNTILLLRTRVINLSHTILLLYAYQHIIQRARPVA